MKMTTRFQVSSAAIGIYLYIITVISKLLLLKLCFKYLPERYFVGEHLKNIILDFNYFSSLAECKERKSYRAMSCYI